MEHTSIYITIVYSNAGEKKSSGATSFLKIQIYSLFTSQTHLLYSSLKTSNQRFTEFDFKKWR